MTLVSVRFCKLGRIFLAGCRRSSGRLRRGKGSLCRGRGRNMSRSRMLRFGGLGRMDILGMSSRRGRCSGRGVGGSG